MFATEGTARQGPLMRFGWVLALVVAVAIGLPFWLGSGARGAPLNRSASLAAAGACPVAGQCGVNGKTGCPTDGPLQPTPPDRCVAIPNTLVGGIIADEPGGGCVVNFYLQVQVPPGLSGYEAVWYSNIGLGSRWWTSPGTVGPASVAGEGASYSVPEGDAAWSVGGGAVASGNCSASPPMGTFGTGGWGVVPGRHNITISGHIKACNAPAASRIGGTVWVSGPGGSFMVTVGPGGAWSVSVPANEGFYTVTADKPGDTRRLSYTTYSFSPWFASVAGTVDATVDFCMSANVYTFPDTTLLSPPAKFWSSAAGQKILKYWGFSEGVGSFLVKVPLDSAKAIKDAQSLAALSQTGVKIVGPANPYLVALSLGLQGGALLDAGYALFVADPYDPDFRTVAVPHPLPAPKVRVDGVAGQKVVNTLLRTVEDRYAVLKALYKSENRAASAKKMGDARAYKLQEHAIKSYLGELANLDDSQVASETTIERVLHGIFGPGGSQITLPYVSRVIYRAEVLSDPVTTDEVKLLSSLGATSEYIHKVIQTELSAQPPTKVDLLDAVVSPSMLQAESNAATLLRAEAAKIPY